MLLEPLQPCEQVGRKLWIAGFGAWPSLACAGTRRPDEPQPTQPARLPGRRTSPRRHAGPGRHLRLLAPARHGRRLPPTAHRESRRGRGGDSNHRRVFSTRGSSRPRARFGRAGSRWWSIGSGIAYDFDEDTDVNLHGIYSVFLTDELEFGVEAAAWYFDQVGDNTGGLSGSMIFRWHFWHWGGDDGFRSTFFGDAGIGLLAGFDDVPDGGTSLNFLPRLGLGYTHALTDDDLAARLTLGLRWHHISNVRIEGEESNPARDSLMIYAEIQFPF